MSVNVRVDIYGGMDMVMGSTHTTHARMYLYRGIGIGGLVCVCVAFGA